MFSILLQIILCLCPILIDCNTSSTFPPLFESLVSYLEETLEWESKESTIRTNVLPEYDFIVVGAGSAGSVVASRLSEIDNWQVLLIEAGEKALHIMDIPLLAPYFQESSINWKYRTVPNNNSCLGYEGKRCKFPRGKVMGGSSVLNYMIYTRGNKKDYDNWAKMGNTGWSYDEVLKYFIKSENANLSHSDMDYHGKHGLLSVTDIPYRTPIARAFVDAGSKIGLPVIDVNGKNQIGINYIQATMKGGRRCSTNTAFLFPAKDIYNKVYKPTEKMDGFVIFPMIMRPKSKGRIWLRDANPFHYPLIDPNYFANEKDLDVAVAGVRIVQKMLKTDAMQKLDAKILSTPLPGCVQHTFDSDEYWKCTARYITFTIYHLSGTCKMGPKEDRSTVVDPRLRVHGINNLRVIDASVIPEIPVAHTNGPTIMIGEKGADMIKEDWGIKII
ncbi:glucose dehydrogenase [FAD, quinone]-like isoform X2 [Sipha flava]|uniref:Glucose dehydrogenase [FAD, quinone]-like isoform X2 n=1 Tax=Sipha flava TaxID=143950 RepID=A0A8B8GIE5_9HEMI|nr:glucose dehydrogenase [FAD, quinone]-like isoform X2 [Sipha flava]